MMHLVNKESLTDEFLMKNSSRVLTINPNKEMFGNRSSKSISGDIVGDVWPGGKISNQIVVSIKYSGVGECGRGV